MLPSMMTVLVPLIFVMVLPAGAQEPSPQSTPARVCVAQIRNQTATKFELTKLRQNFLESLNATKLARGGAVTLVPVEVDSSDDAQTELQKQSCEYAIYTRILRKPKEVGPTTAEAGTTYRMSPREDVPEETYGLQCTVERAASGMPVLIDRQFDVGPTKDDKGVLKLLSAESARIESALAKKLMR